MVVASLSALVAVLSALPARADDKAKPRVAVMDFSSPGAPADLAALGSGLQSMITTDLAQVSSLVVVERARLQEIQKELRLSHSTAVDPATAAQLGKLAGATHLVVGTFAVVGKHMRLDGRLVDVATAKVALAASADGEKDAFFELEKTLVSKLLAAMDLKVTTKERGEVAKIHTTDFEAFRQYAIGVRLSDDKKYDDAIAAMKTALKQDEEFRLARVALSDYERLAAELRGRADSIATAAADQHRLELVGAAAERRKVIERLFAIAQEPDPKARLRRAAASYMLACAYGSFAHGSLDYWGLEDRFASRRLQETFDRRYYADALALWPKVQLHAHCLSSIGPDRPRTMASFDQELKDITSRMGPDLKHMLRTREAAALLHLDLHGEADLTDKLYELGMKLDPPPPIDWQREMLENRARLRHALLDLEQSTRLFKKAADLPEGQTHYLDGHAGLLRRYADQIEANGQLAAFLAALPADSPLREYAMAMEVPVSYQLNYSSLRLSTPKDFARVQQRPEQLAQTLTERRVIASDSYVLLGPSPVWAVGAHGWTGPRRDPRRAEELRYFGLPSKRVRSTFFVVDGLAKKDPGLAWQLAFTTPADFQPSLFGAAGPVDASARPEIFVVLSARCVDCESTPDPATGSWTFAEQPMEAWALALGRERSDLVKVVVHSLRQASKPDQVEVKASQPVGLGAGQRATLAVQVQGNRASLTVNGKSASFQLPADAEAGFYGLLMRGPGFVAVQALRSNETGR